MIEPSFEPIGMLRSRAIHLPFDNVDTDQIFPARFMATTERSGCGDALFADWRADGGKAAALARIKAGECQVLLAGRNFGGGSSREHAVWALVDSGIRVVVALSIADIFGSNAIQNGVLPVEVPPEVHDALVASLDHEIEIDLDGSRLLVPEAKLRFLFRVEPFHRACLMQGRDATGWAMGHMAAIEAFENAKQL